jgi:hypothetical protein
MHFYLSLLFDYVFSVMINFRTCFSFTENERFCSIEVTFDYSKIFLKFMFAFIHEIYITCLHLPIFIRVSLIFKEKITVMLGNKSLSAMITCLRIIFTQIYFMKYWKIYAYGWINFSNAVRPFLTLWK